MSVLFEPFANMILFPRMLLSFAVILRSWQRAASWRTVKRLYDPKMESSPPPFHETNGTTLFSLRRCSVIKTKTILAGRYCQTATLQARPYRRFRLVWVDYIPQFYKDSQSNSANSQARKETCAVVNQSLQSYSINMRPNRRNPGYCRILTRLLTGFISIFILYLTETILGRSLEESRRQ